MNSLTAIWTALSNLARSLNRLAAVADAISEQAEQRVDVIGYHAGTPAVTVDMPAANGTRKRVAAAK